MEEATRLLVAVAEKLDGVGPRTLPDVTNNIRFRGDDEGHIGTGDEVYLYPE